MPNIKRGMMGAAGVSAEGGELWAWGYNNEGALGIGTSGDTSKLSPVQVGSDATWTYAAAGTNKFSLGIREGKLFAWGKNEHGELGLGDTTNRSSPVQVGARADWEKCFAAHQHAAAITSDGDMFMWGRNNMGQLGQGNTTNLSSPTQVAGTWINFSASYGMSSGIKEGYTLWNWGRQFGGAPETGPASAPQQLGSLTDWAVVGSGYATHFVKTDGTMWAFGTNYNSAIGDGTTGSANDRASPIQIGSLTTWRDVQSGQHATFALTTANTMFVWGENFPNGRLGLGNTTNYSSPVQLGSLTTFSKLGRHDGHTQATHIITTGGTLWGWGYNSGTGSLLGDGTNTDRSSPVQIGSLTTWIFIANGQAHTLGIKEA